MHYIFKKVEFGKAVIKFFSENHYTQGSPLGVRHCFGIFEQNGEMIGCAAFGAFINQSQSMAYPNSLEFSRMFIKDCTPKNTESWFIGNCLRWLKKNTTYGAVVAYSDPGAGHIGTIYRASNFKYDGTSSPSYHYLHPDGSREHKRGPWRRAKMAGQKEPEIVLAENLTKIIEQPKSRFIYILNKKNVNELSQLENSKIAILVDPPKDIDPPFDEKFHLAYKIGNKLVLIDKDNDELFKRLTWRVSDQGYLSTKDENWKTVQFHRIIMDAPRGIIIDHMNRAGADNRKCNLRFANNSLNQANRLGLKKFKGVRLKKGKYEAHIIKSGVNHYLGRFAKEDEAAMAYDDKAEELFGQFAKFNFPRVSKNIVEVVPAQGTDMYNEDLYDVIKKYLDAGKKKKEVLKLDNCTKCGEKTFAHNLCYAHYAEYRKDLGEKIRTTPKIEYSCSVSGCKTPAFHIAERLCQAHWREKSGVPKKSLGRPAKEYGACSVCQEPASGSHGLCKSHYLKKYREEHDKTYEYKCSYPGCDKHAFHKKERLCVAHFNTVNGIETRRGPERKENPVRAKNPCSVSGCGNFARHKGDLCQTHKDLYKPSVYYGGNGLGSFLKAKRELVGKSAEFVATLCGYSNNSGYLHIETGRSKVVTSKKMEKIMAAVGFNLEEVERFKFMR